MEISFASRKLQRQLESAREIQRAHGKLAKAIMRRMAVLQAAACLADVPASPPERRHLLKGNMAGCFAVSISGNWRLVFRPAHDPLPSLPDGGPDLQRITAIEIVGILDYH